MAKSKGGSAGKRPSAHRRAVGAVFCCESEHLAAIGKNQAYLMHALRRPLLTIGLLARSIRARGRLRGKDAESLERIIAEASASERLMRNCLQMLRPLRGKRTVVDLRRILDSVRRSLAPRAKSLGVRIVTSFAGATPPRLPAIRRRVRQALLSIAENALDAMHEPGQMLLLACATRPSTITVTVRDDGPGMPAEVRERMFEPFYSTKKHAAGLGLALARHVLLEHGAHITVRSAPGRGTTVILQFPRSPRKPGRQGG